MANHVVKAVKDYIEVEAYKSQLKKLIEERRKELQKEQSIHIKGNDWWTACENRLRELQVFEDSIDQVKPPQI